MQISNKYQFVWKEKQVQRCLLFLLYPKHRLKLLKTFAGCKKSSTFVG